jgi:hypothetical protein
MKDLLSLVFSSFHDAMQAGYGASFVLLIVILALLIVVYGMLRAYSSRLGECEKKHRAQEESAARMQKKFAICVGMIVSLMGNRPVPKGFWETMLDDNAVEIPNIEIHGTT